MRKQVLGPGRGGDQAYPAGRGELVRGRRPVLIAGMALAISLVSLGTNNPADFKEFVKSLMIAPELMTSSNTIVDNLATWNGEVPVTWPNMSWRPGGAPPVVLRKAMFRASDIPERGAGPGRAGAAAV